LSYAWRITEQGEVVLDGIAAELRDNEDSRNSISAAPAISARVLKTCTASKRRKRWL